MAICLEEVRAGRLALLRILSHLQLQRQEDLRVQQAPRVVEVCRVSVGSERWVGGSVGGKRWVGVCERGRHPHTRAPRTQGPSATRREGKPKRARGWRRSQRESVCGGRCVRVAEERAPSPNSSCAASSCGVPLLAADIPKARELAPVPRARKALLRQKGFRVRERGSKLFKLGPFGTKGVPSRKF